MLELLNQSMLLLGPTPLDSLSRDRDLPNCSFWDFLQGFYVCPRPSSLFFIRIRGMVMYPACGTMYSPGSDSWYGKYYRVATAIKVGGPGALFGCGWPLSLEWLQVCGRTTSYQIPVPRMTMVQ